jgi:hypothetical protein
LHLSKRYIGEVKQNKLVAEIKPCTLPHILPVLLFLLLHQHFGFVGVENENENN